MKARRGNEFGIALCDHFNVPSTQATDLKLNVGQDEILSATLTIMLTADDLAAIAERMKALAMGGPVESKQYVVMGANAPDAVSAAEFAASAARHIDRAVKRAP